MSEQLPYADIVIMALVAGFILLRLRSILGQKTGNDNPNFFQPPKEKSEQNAEPIIQLGEKSTKSRTRPDLDPYASNLSEGMVLQGINDIKAKDPLFTATSFLEGSKMAFEMVFDAFIKADKQTLALLLSKEIYDDFINNIDEREKRQSHAETTLLSVAPKQITRVSLDRNIARLSVQFESEQVTIERGKTGDIVSGDPSDVQHVIDEWTFERDITSKNPNWKIIET